MFLGAVACVISVLVATEHLASAVVERLGAPRFIQREHAEKTLVGIGEPALPAVEAGMLAADAEIQWRSRRAREAILMRTWSQLVDEYERGVERRHVISIPFRNHFDSLFGTSDSARRLLAGCLRKNGDLILRMTRDIDAVSREYRLKCREFEDSFAIPRVPNRQDRLQFATLVCVSAILKDKTPLVMSKGTSCVAYLLRNPVVPSLLDDPQLRSTLAELLVAWARKCDPRGQLYFLQLVEAAHLGEALPFLRELVCDNSAFSYSRMAAFYVIGSIGKNDDRSFLQEYLCRDASSAAVSKSNIGWADLALAASLRLSGEDPEKWGLARREVYLLGIGAVKSWSISTYTFRDNHDRHAAILRSKQLD